MSVQEENVLQAQMLYEQAQSYITRRHRRNALSLLERALALHPTYEEALTEYLEVYDSIMPDNGAEDFAGTLVRRFPDNPVINRLLARKFLKKGDYCRVKLHAGIAVQSDPSDVQAYFFLAEAYVALANETDSPDDWNGLAEAILGIHKHPQHTRHVWPWVQLGRAYLGLGAYYWAAEIWERLLGQDPNNLEYMLKWGIALYWIGDPRSAKIFPCVLDRDPHNVVALRYYEISSKSSSFLND